MTATDSKLPQPSFPRENGAPGPGMPRPSPAQRHRDGDDDGRHTSLSAAVVERLEASGWTLRPGANHSVLVAERGYVRLYARRGNKRDEATLISTAIGTDV